MIKFNNPADAADWLVQGKILIHPTEGVWGIGCDAFNQSAVKKINSLKGREASKSLILLAPSIIDALSYLKPLSKSKLEFIDKIWPGHTTVVSDANESILDYLKPINNTVALRVSNHKPIINLMSIFKKLMVSTSANLSNLSTPQTLKEIEENFSDPDVGIYYFKNGNSKKPSAIIDLNSMEYIRE
ncbi:MAG: hypothetical protein CMD68_03435 [Gammaproteobacteria bacterium]|nr:hypothetical protein [Gammaproteobacteria bacterium]